MKQLFNFYVDDEMKSAAMEKLALMSPGNTKGQYAAFLRACTKLLVDTPADKLPPDLVRQIEHEYITCLKTGRRSMN